MTKEWLLDIEQTHDTFKVSGLYPEEVLVLYEAIQNGTCWVKASKDSGRILSVSGTKDYMSPFKKGYIIEADTRGMFLTRKMNWTNNIERKYECFQYADALYVIKEFFDRLARLGEVAHLPTYAYPAYLYNGNMEVVATQKDFESVI